MTDENHFNCCLPNKVSFCWSAPLNTATLLAYKISGKTSQNPAFLNG